MRGSPTSLCLVMTIFSIRLRLVEKWRTSSTRFNRFLAVGASSLQRLTFGQRGMFSKTCFMYIHIYRYILYIYIEKTTIYIIGLNVYIYMEIEYIHTLYIQFKCQHRW